MNKTLRILLLLILILLLIWLLWMKGCKPGGSAGGPGGTPGAGPAPKGCGDGKLGLFDTGIQSSVWPDGTVALTLPVENQGAFSVGGVSLTQFDVQGGTRLAPATLPVALGEVAPDGVSVVDGHYKVGVGSTLAVKAAGTFTIAKQTCSFTIDASFTPKVLDHSPVTAKAGSSQKFNPGTAAYPPTPPKPAGEQEFNGKGVRAPQGPPRNLFPTPPAASGAVPMAPGSLGNPQPLPPGSVGSNQVTILKNTGGGPYGALPPDPNAAGPDASQVAIYTANTGISYSVDGGATFKIQALTGIKDPSNSARTSFFPENDGGVCCDQVVTYVPKFNVFVWMLQYWETPITVAGKPAKSTNRLRIAWATPAAIKADFLHAWTYADLTSAQMGIGQDWMDYPDLSFSDTFLYVGVDHATTNGGGVYSNRRIVTRMSLSDMVGPGPSVGWSEMEPTYNGLIQNHFVQNSHDTAYWTAEPDTSTLTVWSWPDSSNTATPKDIAISSYSNSDYTVTAPDNFNWNAAPAAVLGGARTTTPTFGGPPADFLYFALSAGRNTGGGRAYPYVRIEKINRGDLTLASELDIWNPAYAFSTPALGSPLTGGEDEISLSLATGGGGNYANHAVGFLNDFVVYITTGSNATQLGYNLDVNGNIINDSSGNPTYVIRYGDYFDARNAVAPVTQNGQGFGYSSLAYAVTANAAGKNCAAGGCSINLQYILWGRPGELTPPPPPVVH